jgi:hypothetical protein
MRMELVTQDIEAAEILMPPVMLAVSQHRACAWSRTAQCSSQQSRQDDLPTREPIDLLQEIAR